MKKDRISFQDLNGLETAELLKLVRSGVDETIAMSWGVAMIARRRAGENELKWDDAVQMSQLELNNWLDVPDLTQQSK